MRAFTVLLSFLITFFCAAEEATKPRVLVLTDIGGDPDDQQSMVRFLSYCNEFDVEGLIATSRMDHGKDTKPELIREQVEAYGKVRENLLLHAPGFPTADFLLQRIKSGQPDADHDLKTPPVFGEGKDTEGSTWIVSVAGAPDPRPLWITIWGGSTDLAQALWKIRATRTPEQADALTAKLRVYAIGDQDGAAAWIKKEFPKLFYIDAHAVPGAPFSGTYRGVYQNESLNKGVTTPLVDKALYHLNTIEWIDEHVRQNHGPLGALYPDNAVQTPLKVKGLKEGDTPSFLYLIPNGLNTPAEPSWGGWGGRFNGPGPLYKNAEDAHPGGSADPVLRQKWTVARWRSAFQNDFAARMDWHVKPFKDANHPPLVRVAGELARTVASGERIALDASASTDPDDNALSFSWSIYREAGSFVGDVNITDANKAQASFIAPSVDAEKQLHVLLTVTDDGAPPLTRYKRIVFTVRSAAK